MISVLTASGVANKGWNWSSATAGIFQRCSSQVDGIQSF